MTLETVSTVNQALIILTSSGLLSLAYLAGKMIQRITQLEVVQAKYFTNNKSQTDDINSIRIDIAEIKQIIASQSRDLDFIKEQMLKEN